MKTSAKRLLAAAAILAAQGAVIKAEAASKYGCFRVSASAMNIRARPYSDADVIGVATKGAILEKRKFLCTLRGYWCAVRTSAGLEGYGDKSLMDKIPCP